MLRAGDRAPTEFEVAEATILELQGAMQEGQVTSAELVDLHLARIRAYDRDGPALNALVRMNPLAANRRRHWTPSGRRGRFGVRCTASPS